MNTLHLCYGDPDECQNCGGSASLGGTQLRLVTPDGTYCSTECHDEAMEFRERTSRHFSENT